VRLITSGRYHNFLSTSKCCSRYLHTDGLLYVTPAPFCVTEDTSTWQRKARVDSPTTHNLHGLSTGIQDDKLLECALQVEGCCVGCLRTCPAALVVELGTMVACATGTSNVVETTACLVSW
jgi:hypothetical protein